MDTMKLILHTGLVGEDNRKSTLTSVEQPRTHNFGNQHAFPPSEEQLRTLILVQLLNVLVPQHTVPKRACIFRASFTTC